MYAALTLACNNNTSGAIIKVTEGVFVLETLNMTMELELIGQVNVYLGIGIQIIFALFLGGLVGYDREVKLKAAGLKTNIMICIGATLYTTISLINITDANSLIDPNRVSAQIVSGIGFLGAGAIIQGRGSVTGLTTAATIWVVAAIGYTIGVGFPVVATVFSLAVLSVLKLMNPLNKLLERKNEYGHFHIEILAYENAWISIEAIFAEEDIALKYFEEEKKLIDGSLSVINLFVKAHPRAVERISNELLESIKVKKLNFKSVPKIPDHLVQSAHNQLNLIKKSY